MHTFCRPLDGDRSQLSDDECEQLAPLANFVSQFTGLRDLVWAAGWYIPPSILSYISVRGCRLHHHNFHLPSLIQHQDKPRPISAADYALCTSPSLYSIVIDVGSFKRGNFLNHHAEALHQMTSGLATNLTQVYSISTRSPGKLEVTRSILLGKSIWKGFFTMENEDTRSFKPDDSVTHGRLQSLVCPRHVPWGISHSSRPREFSQLRCLVMPWNWNGIALTEAASRGDLMSLTKLELTYIETKTEQLQNSLQLLLSSLNPLSQLNITGYISPQTFDIVVQRHGEALRVLSVNPQKHENRSELVTFSGPVISNLADRSLNLTHLTITINKTRSDRNEVIICRALGKIPRLEYLHLRLKYNVGPDVELWDNERDGEYPMANGLGSEIPFTYIYDAFTNAAVDATLAKAMFNLASTQGSLKHLEISPENNREGQSVDQHFHGDFLSALRWFAHPWLCTRDSRGGLSVKELERYITASCGEDWDRCFVGIRKDMNWFEEQFQGWFGRVWGPQKSEDWKNDWESLPLDLGKE